MAMTFPADPNAIHPLGVARTFPIELVVCHFDDDGMLRTLRDPDTSRYPVLQVESPGSIELDDLTYNVGPDGRVWIVAYPGNVVVEHVVNALRDQRGLEPFKYDRAPKYAETWLGDTAAYAVFERDPYYAVNHFAMRHLVVWVPTVSPADRFKLTRAYLRQQARTDQTDDRSGLRDLIPEDVEVQLVSVHETAGGLYASFINSDQVVVTAAVQNLDEFIALARFAARSKLDVIMADPQVGSA